MEKILLPEGGILLIITCFNIVKKNASDLSGKPVFKWNLHSFLVNKLFLVSLLLYSCHLSSSPPITLSLLPRFFISLCQIASLEDWRIQLRLEKQRSKWNNTVMWKVSDPWSPWNWFQSSLFDLALDTTLKWNGFGQSWGWVWAKLRKANRTEDK